MPSHDSMCLQFPHINTLRPRQNGRHFPDDILEWIFLNEDVWISINISLKFIPRGPINNIPTLVQVMAWRRPGDKPYLNQWWLDYRRIYASLGLNELTRAWPHCNNLCSRCDCGSDANPCSREVIPMMTSSNGNIFRVTGPLCGEFAGHRWIPLALSAGNSRVTGEFHTQRPVTRSFDVFFICPWINGCVNNCEAGDLRRHRAHYDVIVMPVLWRPRIEYMLVILLLLQEHGTGQEKVPIAIMLVIRRVIKLYVGYSRVLWYIRLPYHVVHYILNVGRS